MLSRRRKKHPGTMYEGLAEELSSELSHHRELLFSPSPPLLFLRELPRYIEGFRSRIDAAYLHPGKYRKRCEPVNEYKELTIRLERAPQAGLWESAKLLLDLRMGSQDYLISLFGPQSLMAGKKSPEKQIQHTAHALTQLYSAFGNEKP
jgi:hypothetical protein